jgi:hypothetical protein
MVPSLEMWKEEGGKGFSTKFFFVENMKHS